MSGIDERKWNCRCPECGEWQSVVLYTNEVAGWIVPKYGVVKKLGFDILLAARFNSEKKIVRAECFRCGVLNKNVQNAAIELFKKSIREKTCLSWEGYCTLLTQGLR